MHDRTLTEKLISKHFEYHNKK